MKTSKKLIFFGTEQLSAGVFEQLLRNGFKFEYAFTKPPTARGRGQKTSPTDVESLAQKYNVPVKHAGSSAELKSLFANLPAADYAGVLVAFGLIIPQNVLDFFKPTGIINLHPSLLPKYRGPSPIEATMLNGDKVLGISIMRLEAKMDAGPVYTQTQIALTGNETKAEMYELVIQHGAEVLIKNLPHILDGSLNPSEQNESEATYCQMLKKDDGTLRPSDFSALELERQVRAYAAFPKSRYTLNDMSIIITKAHVATQNDAEAPFKLNCKDGSILVIDELIAPSGKTMTAEAFKRGYLRT